MDYVIVGLYAVCLFIIFLYSLAQLNLFSNYLKSKKNSSESLKFNFNNVDEIPFITVQLPVYNELYVVDRLLDNISKLQYYSEKLEIQVLDDSTDQSIERTSEKIKLLQRKGIDITHIIRNNRNGFKAGALKEGLKSAKGEFIAVFDSDFLPKPDWLLQTVPYFKDEKIGVVQTRWGHINRNYSMLTKIQAFALDFHFVLEQVGRNYGQHFINFNGTAGIWRKACILDAGNWKGDTLTEDLDLSYRAQLNNWKFKYLEDVETPAELPIVMSAARSQQFRWNKGAAENFQKFNGKLLNHKSLSFGTKFHSFFHLLNSSMFIVVLLISLLSVPVLYIKKSHPELDWVFNILAFFVVSTIIFFLCYWKTYSKINGTGIKNFIKFIGMFIGFFSVAMGFSLHNTIAVLEGHIGRKSSFIRTPKFNIEGLKNSWKTNIYINKKLSPIVYVEFVLFVYFGFAIYSAFYTEDFGLIIFHLMLFFGFGFVSIKSLLSSA